MMRRRRPLARAALVGGGAYYAGKKHAEGPGRGRRARGRSGGSAGGTRSPAGSALRAAPAPTAAGDDEMVTKLTNLKGLLDSGVLTQAEFDAAKAKVLAGG